MRTDDLLERGHLVDALERALTAARASSGSMVLVAGEAGIGKTTLVQRFSSGLAGDVRVLTGACDAMATPRPLGPLLDMASDLGDVFIGALEGERRGPIFDLFLDALRGRTSPTLVVIEDVHWADDATLDLLRFLGRRVGTTTSLVIATYRDDEVGPRHPLRAVIGDLATSAAVVRMALPALTGSAVARLAVGHDVDVEALHRTTGGNPFFVSELLRAGSRVLPPTVRDAVMARAARLGAAARRTLDVASVIGVPFDPALLVALGADVDAIEACEGAGLLRMEDALMGFRHDLVRVAVYHSLAASRRRDLHGRVLATLEASATGRDDLATLAHHAAEAVDASAVLRIAPAAARRAAALGAHREAHAQYERTLRFLAELDASDRAELLEAYATECTILDRLDESASVRADVVARWRELGRTKRVGLNLSLLSQAYRGLGRNRDAESASIAAVDVLEPLGPSPELVRAYWYRANLRMLEGDIDAVLDIGRLAIDLSVALGEFALEANAHMTVGTALLLADRAGSNEHLERSLALGYEHHLPNLVATVHVNRGSVAAEYHRFDEARAELARAATMADDHGHDNIRLLAVAWQALTALYAGDWTSASETALRVVGRRQLSTPARIVALVTLGRVRARRGDPDAATVLEEALVLANGTGSWRQLAPVRAARAEAASLAGDEDAVRDEARSIFTEVVHHRHPWLVGELGYWLWTVGDLDALPADAAMPFALEVAGLNHEAAAAWDALGCPYERSRALAASDFEADWRDALATFARLGAIGASTVTTRRLRELGARGVPRGSRPRTLDHPAHLTPREAAVLAGMAEGLRNREIAARQRVSPRTIDHQVSAVLAKLGVRTRTEAVAEAHRRGLLGDKA